MARKEATVWEMQQKKEFDKLAKQYCVSALKNIWEIATSCLDMKTRLQANVFIVEKAVGKEYRTFKDTNEDSANVTIKLVKHDSNNVYSYKKQEDIIKQVEQEENKWNDWEIGVNDNDDWGNEVYDPE